MSPAPIVLVHGNPETEAVWDPLLDALPCDDVVRLRPPGFGAALPASFDATMAGYRDWLVGELETLGRPVHLVGHDWGGLHALNLAMARPELLASWVSDAAGVYDPGYVWHPLAQVWQTAGAGEAWLQAAFSASQEQRVEAMRELLDPDASSTGPGDEPGRADRADRADRVDRVDRVARRLVTGQGPDMARAVLSLYRSAAQPAMARAGRGLAAAAARPGLVVDATDDDTTGSSAVRARTAGAAGARIARLEGLGHWWMVQDPHRSAQVLTDFWDSLPDPDARPWNDETENANVRPSEQT